MKIHHSDGDCRVLVAECDGTPPERKPCLDDGPKTELEATTQKLFVSMSDHPDHNARMQMLKDAVRANTTTIGESKS